MRACEFFHCFHSSWRFLIKWLTLKRLYDQLKLFILYSQVKTFTKSIFRVVFQNSNIRSSLDRDFFRKTKLLSKKIKFFEFPKKFEKNNLVRNNLFFSKMKTLTRDWFFYFELKKLISIYYFYFGIVKLGS